MPPVDELANNLRALKADRDRYLGFAFASADILMEVDPQGIITFADGALRGLLALKSDYLIGKPFTSLVEEKDRERAGNMLKGLNSKVKRIENVDLKLTGKGLPMAFTASAFSLETTIYVSLSLKEKENIAGQLDRRDMVTGLLNKDGFVEEANQKILTAKQDVEMTFIDFMTLKSMLDRMTPDQATKMMDDISDYLKSKSLGGDTAGLIKEGTFSVVHETKITKDQISTDLMQIAKNIAPTEEVQMRIASVAAKAGSKLTKQDSARAILYTINNFAKSKGGDFSINSLTEGYQEMLSQTVEQISQFKETVSDEKFDIAFQPIVDIQNGIIHHYECLVRLKEGAGFQNPFQFITFGEETGYISEFDLLMTSKTLGLLMEARLNDNNPVVSINISGKSLSSSLFMDTFREVLSKHDKVKKQLILEVTESSKIQDMKVANDFIQEMRKAGNLCCLDDFGVAESSFDYLRSLQVDFVKIDGSYIRESMKTDQGRKMLKAMGTLLSSLKIVGIGEMVETEEEAKFLFECGVRFGQGYLFGKPSLDQTELKNCGKASPYQLNVIRARNFRKKD
ncbi:MAG: EAL domain-containing protein [Rickettsiales bacterium]